MRLFAVHANFVSLLGDVQRRSNRAHEYFPSPRLVNYSTNDLLYVNAIVPTPSPSFVLPSTRVTRICSVYLVYFTSSADSMLPILILIKRSTTFIQIYNFRYSSKKIIFFRSQPKTKIIWKNKYRDNFDKLILILSHYNIYKIDRFNVNSIILPNS